MLLTRPPLPLRGVRLACVKPAASVRSEPESNSQVEVRSRRDIVEFHDVAAKHLRIFDGKPVHIKPNSRWAVHKLAFLR